MLILALALTSCASGLTEAEVLELIRANAGEGTAGAQGPAGDRGPQGIPGPKGDTGDEGTKGKSFMTVEWEVPPNDAIGDGIWRVGTDIHPGLYRTMLDTCYWARLRNLTGRDDIIANDNTDGPSYVEILATDVAFQSTRCGPWTKVEE